MTYRPTGGPGANLPAVALGWCPWDKIERRSMTTVFVRGELCTDAKKNILHGPLRLSASMWTFLLDMGRSSGMLLL